LPVSDWGQLKAVPGFHVKEDGPITILEEAALPPDRCHAIKTFPQAHKDERAKERKANGRSHGVAKPYHPIQSTHQRALRSGPYLPENMLASIDPSAMVSVDLHSGGLSILS
jgi:hypothetical protein